MALPIASIPVLTGEVAQRFEAEAQANYQKMLHRTPEEKKAVKEEKTGLVCQSSASIRHPRFLLFPLLEKGLSKKGKDRSDVSYFILK